MHLSIHDGYVALFSALQIPLWFVILSFVTDHPKLTVQPAFLPDQLVGPGHQLCRFIASLAYIGAIVGAAASTVGIMTGALDFNRAGVVISRVSGVVIGFHVAGVFWQLVTLARALQGALGLSKGEFAAILRQLFNGPAAGREARLKAVIDQHSGIELGPWEVD